MFPMRSQWVNQNIDNGIFQSLELLKGFREFKYSAHGNQTPENLFPFAFMLKNCAEAQIKVEIESTHVAPGESKARLPLKA